MSSKKQENVKLAAVSSPTQQRMHSARFHHVQEKARLKLADLVARMFDQADDALFEMADRASSNHDQNIYFESMRELRIKRRGMEMAFVQRYDSAFLDLDKKKRDELSEQEIDIASLSLVNDNEIEEMLAVEGMVARAMSDCADELSLLSMRFDSLVDTAHICNANNPIAPLPICEAFAQTCSNLDVDIKARLLVLKLFEKFVVKELPRLYQTLNRDLAEDGVLTNISLADQVRRNRHGADYSDNASMADAKANHHDTSVGTHSDDVFAELQSLLQHAGRLYAGSGQQRGAPGVMSRPEAGPEQVKIVRRAMVLDLLTNLQGYMPAVPTDATGYVAAMPEHQDIRELIVDTLNQNEEDGRYALGEVDEDAINIVSLLFQFVLEDDNLADPLKSLLSLLQVPMAKVALIDKSFFGKHSHPARKLLNSMAHAGIGWAPSGNADRDFLYRKFKQAVETILTTFDDDIDVFQSVLVDFMSFMDNERRRANIVEQRTLEAEQGRAKAEIAQATVASTIDARVAGKELPGVVTELLQHAWSKVLFLIYAREGESSGSWQSACRVMDELIWSVQPRQSPADYQRLATLKPGLYNNIRNGLGRVGFSHFALNHFFAQLDAFYANQLAEKSPPAAAPSPVQSAPSIPEPVVEPAAAAGTLDQLLSSSRSYTTGAIPEPGPEMTTVERPVAAANNEDLLQDVDEAMLSAVDKLSMGSWVQFNQGETASYRCRLAAVLKPSGKYIFVNRAGKKVAEWSRAQLAANVAKDIVMLLDDRQLFDRALESVISQLQHSRG